MRYKRNWLLIRIPKFRVEVIKIITNLYFFCCFKLVHMRCIFMIIPEMHSRIGSNWVHDGIFLPYHYRNESEISSTFHPNVVGIKHHLGRVILWWQWLHVATVMMRPWRNASHLPELRAKGRHCHDIIIIRTSRFIDGSRIFRGR